MLLNLFCVFVILAVPFRFTTFDDSRSIEDTFIILAVPCGWMHLLLYARVLKVTGPFVVMIYKMIIGDILTFATIYLLLLFGFSMGEYNILKNGPINSNLIFFAFSKKDSTIFTKMLVRTLQL